MVKNRNIPFGYCMVNGKYALNAPEAETVQEISCFRKTGVSYIFHKPHKYAIIESKKVLKKQHPKGEEKCGKSK